MLQKRMSGSRSVLRVDRLLSAGFATAWLLLLAFAAIVLANPWPDFVLWIDFSSYWMAASFLRDGLGASLYDAPAQLAFELDLRTRLGETDLVRSMSFFNPYPNLPPLALLYLPFTFMPIPQAYIFWWLVSMASFLVAVAIPLRGSSLGRSAAVLALSFAPVTTTLFEGQPYGLFLLILVLAVMSFRIERPLLGGALLGLLWLKPQYAVLFPLLFIFKRRWTELAGISAVGLVILVGSVALVGTDGIPAYLRLLNQIGDFSSDWVNPSVMVNWRSVLINAWPGVPDRFGQPIVFLLGTSTILASLVVWRGPWVPSSPRFLRQLLVLLLALLVASPHSHIHGAVMILAPTTLALRNSEKRTPFTRLELLLVPVLYIAFFAVWPGGIPRWVLGPIMALVMFAMIVQDLLTGRAGPTGSHVEATG